MDAKEKQRIDNACAWIKKDVYNELKELSEKLGLSISGTILYLINKNKML